MNVREDIQRGRGCFARRAWAEACEALSLADRKAPLDPGDLELLAVSAYLTGRAPEFHRCLERAHRVHLEAGECERAARCAFWLGLMLLLRGEAGQANGWLARARRLVAGRDCVEHGYLLVPLAEQQLAGGDDEAARANAAAAVAIGERFGDADLAACARHLQGRAQLQRGQLQAGLALLDEAMLAATAGELSPLLTGLIYCSVIQACQQVFAFSRAREWTDALAQWCEHQPELVAFTTTCLVHRAEVMQFHGAWAEAMAEAQRACERFHRGADAQPPAAALYRQGEIHRLRGELQAAEEAYRHAGRLGYEPQPGLALLRLAQGRTDVACAAVRRTLSALTDPLQRAQLLPACIEILVAAGDVGEARCASGELDAIAEKHPTEVLQAMAAHARGAVDLAAGDAPAALQILRRAVALWQQIDAPHEAARARVLTALACRALGDEDGAVLEFDAAQAVFGGLEAAPDLARLASLRIPPAAGGARGLTVRELQVLRLIANGSTNRAIAAELCLSERTIDRHVSNILTKLDVPSRAAATAYACNHKLL